MSKIGVIFPSRGLCFSRTADELLKNLKGIDYRIFFSHGKPIPDCFNEPIMYALDDTSITHIWIVEDDMILPPNILKTMLDKDKAVVTADYPITSEGRGSVFKDADGRVLYCGTGCLLIKREVFEEMQAPYFKTDTKWNVKNYGDHIKFSSRPNKNKDGYGLHDITFCFELYRKNIPIHVVRKKLGQRKLINLGKAGTNNGAHNIKEWTKITPNKRLKEIQSYPAEKTGDLIQVVVDGKTLNVSEDHAKKLVKQKGGKIPPKRASYIIWGEDE